MTDMAERVGRAMRCKLSTALIPAALHDSEWGDVACEVIAAMREPTEAMLKAGADEAGSYDVRAGEAGDIWRAMIDAALELD